MNGEYTVLIYRISSVWMIKLCNQNRFQFARSATIDLLIATELSWQRSHRYYCETNIQRNETDRSKPKVRMGATLKRKKSNVETQCKKVHIFLLQHFPATDCRMTDRMQHFDWQIQLYQPAAMMMIINKITLMPFVADTVIEVERTSIVTSATQCTHACATWKQKLRPRDTKHAWKLYLALQRHKLQRPRGVSDVCSLRQSITFTLLLVSGVPPSGHHPLTGWFPALSPSLSLSVCVLCGRVARAGRKKLLQRRCVEPVNSLVVLSLVADLFARSRTCCRQRAAFNNLVLERTVAVFRWNEFLISISRVFTLLNDHIRYWLPSSTLLHLQIIHLTILFVLLLFIISIIFIINPHRTLLVPCATSANSAHFRFNPPLSRVVFVCFPSVVSTSTRSTTITLIVLIQTRKVFK